MSARSILLIAGLAAWALAAWASVGQEQRERGEVARFPKIVGTRGMTPSRYRIEIEVEDRIAGLRARREGVHWIEWEPAGKALCICRLRTARG